jgi:hypothetical protein
MMRRGRNRSRIRKMIRYVVKKKEEDEKKNARMKRGDVMI